MNVKTFRLVAKEHANYNQGGKKKSEQYSKVFP